jgi:CDP-glucose 4,6-dehydratase
VGDRQGPLEGVDMTPSFWKGRDVFITGITGFKGSWLALQLLQLGAKVSGFALSPPTNPSLFAHARLADVVDWTEGDVRCLDALSASMKQNRPDIVFHLAAQPLVRASYEQPVETFDTNVMGTVNLLESVRRSPATQVVVVVTSDKCYEDHPVAMGYREDDRLGGHDPYAASKACAELVTTAYRRSWFEHGGPATVTARAGNVIGGGDWARDRLVPDVIAALASQRPAVIRNPSCVRPWQHVLDPLAGYILLAERAWLSRREFDSAWNFGPSPESVQTVSIVADEICRQWGDRAEWRHEETHQAHESLLLTIDSEKARSKLGWKPAMAYEQAVAWTTRWYRAVLDGRDARPQTLRQIDEYRELAA